MTDLVPGSTLNAARQYIADGWSPIPLAAATKWPPPNGVTGWRGCYTNLADLHRKEWDWTGNIAIRLPPDVVGIDVDAYHGGSVEPLEQAYGKLPPTVWSTSRDDGSGIALFRVPNGTVLATDPAEGIDTIQAHHRYVVCAPSMHPDGRPYRWIDEMSEDDLDGPPEPGELPELPWAWIQALSTDKTGAANAATPPVAAEFVTTHTAASRPNALSGATKKLQGARKGGRHDALVTVACWMMREAAAGLYTAEDAVAALHAWWIDVMSDEPLRRESGEFGGAILWAIGQAEAEPERVEAIRTAPTLKPPPNIDPATGEIIANARNLPAEFWEARPELAHIRQAAHCRSRSADAVMLFTLARVCATIPPAIKLPATVGGLASLNFLGAVIGPSGTGKSTAGAVARELVPIERRDVVADMPLGSGEGLAELYFEWVMEEQADGKSRKVKRKTRDGLYMYLDEGQALGEMGSRKGATLLPTLRAAWSGETIGNANATAETFRVVQTHTYRMALMVGFQPEHAQGLLDDTTGGTPQRFVFANAVDPTIPDEAPGWPGELPLWLPAVTGPSQVYGIDPAIAAEVRVRDLLANRDHSPRPLLDSHRDLVRTKVAALLAFLAGRLDIDSDDWRLAGMVMRSSVAVRTWVLETARTAAATAELAGHRRAATRETVIASEAEQRALDSAARSIARRVWSEEGVAVMQGQLNRAMSGRCRQLVSIEEVVAEAERLKWIKRGPLVDGSWMPGEARPA